MTSSLPHVRLSTKNELSSHPNDERQWLENSFASSMTNSSDAVRIEICDIEDGCQAETTALLRKCQSKVLGPYSKILTFVGWQAFGRDSPYSSSCWYKFLNFFYTLFLIAVQLYSMTYVVVSCSGRLQEDWSEAKPAGIWTGPPIHFTTGVTKAGGNETTPTTPIPTTLNTTISVLTSTNSSHPSLRFASFDSVPILPVSRESESMDQVLRDPCRHLVSLYILPCIIHSICYVIGCAYFRWLGQNEQMQSLSQKVFIQGVSSGMNASSFWKRNLSGTIFRVRLFLYFGIAWVCMTLVMKILFYWTYGLEANKVMAVLDNQIVSYVLFVAEIAGGIVVNVVRAVVVVTYAMQIEMIVCFLQSLRVSLQERSIELRTAMQSIVEIREHIRRLNAAISWMLGLCILTFVVYLSYGLIVVLNPYITPPSYYDAQRKSMFYFYHWYYPTVWLIIVMLPFIQASRITVWGNRLKQVSYEIRVFGYKSLTQLDLDFFIQFLNSANLRATICAIPIRPVLLAAVSTTIIFFLWLGMMLGFVGPQI